MHKRRFQVSSFRFQVNRRIHKTGNLKLETFEVALRGSNLDTGKNKVEGEHREKNADASSNTTRLTLAQNSYLVMTLQKGAAPEAKVAGDKITVGNQTLNFK